MRDDVSLFHLGHVYEHSLYDIIVSTRIKIPTVLNKIVKRSIWMISFYSSQKVSRVSQAKRKGVVLPSCLGALQDNLSSPWMLEIIF